MREREPRRETSMAKDIRPTDGRQGVTGHGVRYVLGFSLAGIVIVFAILYFAFAA